LGFQIGVPNWGPKSGYHNWYSYTEEVSDGTFEFGFYVAEKSQKEKEKQSYYLHLAMQVKMI
jgi:hypothetical protein